MHAPSPSLLHRFGLSAAMLEPACAAALGSLEEENRLLRAALLRAEQEAERDALTGLLNRRGLLRELARSIARCERQGHEGAVLFGDIDAFKRLNDGYGHSAGDGALQHVAGLLRMHLRLEDCVARLGGDEFVAVLGAVRLADAKAKAVALAAKVEAAPFIFEGVVHSLSLSIGAAPLRAGDDPERVLAKADEAMYAAKQAQRRRDALEALGRG